MQYGSNPTDTITGVIIYPDDFSFADAGVGAMQFGAYKLVEIDMDAWEALEDAGCVFVPGTATRNFDGATPGTPGMTESNAGISCFYWSASTINKESATTPGFNFQGRTSPSNENYQRWAGRAVRLVQDY